MAMNKLRLFLKKKNVEISGKRYFIDALSAMAMGLFSSLLVGTILRTVGQHLHIAFLTDTVWPLCRNMTGAAIGVAVAYSLKAHTFVLFAAAIAGTAGNTYGGAVGAFISAIVGAELGKLVSKETKIDLIVTPTVTILAGSIVAVCFGPYMAACMNWLGSVIMTATNLHPFLMGICLAVLVGIILTLPISSAALCMMLSLSGLAGGAAAAGCCAQMIGFAVMSYRDNGFGGSFAVGIGTSMLHMPNIIKNPRIWIPPIAASAVLGPISTVWLKLENTPIGSGMGTCGLVGQIGAVTAMNQAGRGSLGVYLSVLLLHIIAPAILTILFTAPLRKIGWIKAGDLKLEL